MATTYPSILEENIERVVESVVRNVGAGRGAVPDDDAMSSEPVTAEVASEDEARETLADLCGHVAYALKTLETGPQALASYRAPEPPATAPTLNLVR
ncbi:MAG: hypothetical protein ABI026_00415 [Gemmatimonadaceae bacterium]